MVYNVVGHIPARNYKYVLQVYYDYIHYEYCYNIIITIIKGVSSRQRRREGV